MTDLPRMIYERTLDRLAEMSRLKTKTYEDGLREAAGLCQEAATRLLSNGKARVNQIDRHTAEVLSAMGKRITALKDLPDV